MDNKKKNISFQTGEIKEVVKIGITGGYGIMHDIDVKEIIDFETPFGKPSHPLVIGRLGEVDVAFIPRHSKNHEIPSHAVNYRANIFTFYKYGVNKIISANAAGSLNKNISPGDIAIPYDYIDYTKNRKNTFYDGYPVHHICPLNPFCFSLIPIAEQKALELNFKVHSNVTVIIIEGPRFSTIAESKLFQKFGADVINMSIYPEVSLARELGMCYLNFALITDYDAGCIGSVKVEPVTLELIDSVQDKYKAHCTKLISNIANSISGIICNDCKSHMQPARKRNNG